jgi:hypothetical protein
MKGRKKVAKKKKEDPRIRLIGATLAGLRQGAGHTSAEKFAFTHDISRSQYASYEKGADMRISSLLRVLDAHGITLQEFFAKGFD